ncbi:uncharacterized protein LOC133176057 [Saccostrea echinata]|uniref:uncharacterized protein LOC133176057 n=1 Tax=Saccostrea echinata TaxID=191078 RepID=UPI002A83F6ED|nr:uncharacterized protein LOC133176057 [Saccostrea echinata]
MDTQRFSNQCKVQKCSPCQGDTEFYCNTCKYDFCLKCKEEHVIDLDTIYHDVVIYRGKFDYIPNQETCRRHPNRIYEMFCQSCDLPVCFQCKEHRKHQTLDIRTAYKTNRHQYRGIIHSLRSETLYNSCFLLAGIKTDIKTCHTDISKCQSEMSTKAQRLKILLDTVISEIKYRQKSFLIHRLHQQMRKMNRHLTTAENYEHRSEQLANRPVKFLLFLTKTRVPKIKDTPNISQQALLSLTGRFNMVGLIKMLRGIQIIETGKRHVRNECLLKLLSTPVILRSVTLTGVSKILHFSFVTSDRFWICDERNLILTNTAGDILHHLTDSGGWGVHTVNIICDLIYIDRDYNITTLSKDNRTKSTLKKFADPWEPHCVFCSPSNGDLLVGMFNTNTDTAKVNRYNDKGQHIQTIQHNNSGQELYSRPIFITENRNGDVIVCDLWGYAVVVTECGGRYRFSYTGPPSRSELYPQGMCTDALSHILVCDGITDTVQMINRDGHFLSLIETRQQGIDTPCGLSYDDKTHSLFVGSLDNSRVCVYRYIQRQYCPKGICDTQHS